MINNDMKFDEKLKNRTGRIYLDLACNPEKINFIKYLSDNKIPLTTAFHIISEMIFSMVKKEGYDIEIYDDFKKEILYYAKLIEEREKEETK